LREKTEEINQAMEGNAQWLGFSQLASAVFGSL